MSLKHLNNKDPWMLGEDIPNCDFFFSTLWLNCFVNEFRKNTGRAYSKILCKFEGYHLWFYFGKKDSNLVAENIAKRIVGERGYAAKINKNIIIQADRLKKFSAKIPQTNLNKLSSKKLGQIYKQHNDIHAQYYTWCWIPVAADMFHNNLTSRVKRYLRGLGVPADKINEYLVILTQPVNKSLILIEQEGLLKIAAKIEKLPKLANKFRLAKNLDLLIKSLPKNILQLLTRHYQKYYYTKHLWVEGEYSLNDYLLQLQELLNSPESVKSVLLKHKFELKKVAQKKNILLNELGVSKVWRAVLDEFGNFMVTKIYRRYAQLLAVHHMSPVLKEIARRKFLTEKQVRFMRPAEVKQALLKNIINGKELLARIKYCVYYAEKNQERVFVGEAARKIMKSVEKKVNLNVALLQGEVGAGGFAQGRVKVIVRASEMKKMKAGDILVSIATDPDIVPAMKKAAAIVTDQGGVTSHAAIVSRELGIPCVIGTKIATQVFKDGDLVEVDANRGIVRKI